MRCKSQENPSGHRPVKRKDDEEVEKKETRREMGEKGEKTAKESYG